jgi:hypothetical protein
MVFRTDHVEHFSGVIRLVWSLFEYKAKYLALPKDLEFIPGVEEAGALR